MPYNVIDDTSGIYMLVNNPLHVTRKTIGATSCITVALMTSKCAIFLTLTFTKC